MKFGIFAVAASVVVLQAGSASAGVFSDDMAKCLVIKSSAADRATLVQWIFSAMTANAAVAGLSNMTDAQRQEHTHQASQLFQRLLLDDCRKETIAAIKNEGTDALRQSFSVLGQAAMQSLISDPGVAKQMSGLAQGLDKARWTALAKEMGVPPETFTGAK